MRNKKILRLVFVALFAALISAGAFIAVPIGPVPIALQNLFALLSGLVLGPVLGTAAVGLFLAAGIIGAPVFANNGAPMGIARLLVSPSGGFLFGYLLCALVAGFIVGFPRPGVKTPIWRIVLAIVAGLLVVYIPGLIRLKFFMKDWDWKHTFIAGFLPFMPGDTIKGVIAGLISPRLRRNIAQLFV